MPKYKLVNNRKQSHVDTYYNTESLLAALRKRPYIPGGYTIVKQNMIGVDLATRVVGDDSILPATDDPEADAKLFPI